MTASNETADGVKVEQEAIDCLADIQDAGKQDESLLGDLSVVLKEVPPDSLSYHGDEIASLLPRHMKAALVFGLVFSIVVFVASCLAVIGFTVAAINKKAIAYGLAAVACAVTVIMSYAGFVVFNLILHWAEEEVAARRMR